MFLIDYSDSFNLVTSCSQMHFNHTSLLFISIEAYLKQCDLCCLYSMYFPQLFW